MQTVKLIIYSMFFVLCTSCVSPGGLFSGTFVLRVAEMNHLDKDGQKIFQEKTKYEWIFSVDRNVADEQQKIAEKAKTKIINLRENFRNNKINSSEYEKESLALMNAMKNLEDKGREKQNDDGYNSLSVEKAFIDAWYNIRELTN